MKFTVTTRIGPNKLGTVQTPSMLHSHHLIPESVRIELEQTGERPPARDIQCKILTGNTELENNQEAFFNVSDGVNLSNHYKALQRVGDLTLHITNRMNEPRVFRVSVEYTKCEGVLMHQERYDNFDKVFTNAATVGYCTRLVLSFNKQVPKIQIRPLAECDPGETQFTWLSVQDIEPCDTIDPDAGGRSVFVIADEDMEQLASYMEYLELVVDPAIKENLQLYVLAYGFPKK